MIPTEADILNPILVGELSAVERMLAGTEGESSVRIVVLLREADSLIGVLARLLYEEATPIPCGRCGIHDFGTDNGRVLCLEFLCGREPIVRVGAECDVGEQSHSLRFFRC